MLFIHKTVSVCNKCYRHIPGIVYEEDGLIILTKKCVCSEETFTAIVETDVEFYHSLKHDFHWGRNQVLFEITDKCQLSCPHCYHLPDNKKTDRTMEDIMSQLNSFPTSVIPSFAGAEPGLRHDLPEICKAISDKGFSRLTILSNGLRFADKKFAQACYDGGLREFLLGLNHPSYQGMAVHTKQLKARQVLEEVGYIVGYTGYTLQSLDELPFIMEEIDGLTFDRGQVRIRCGSFIGRSEDKEKSYLSKLVKQFKKLGGNDVRVEGEWDDNPYHYMLYYKDILVRLIQWPDVENIDMEELATGPWCQFFDGPISNFVHQVIIRDAVKNMGLPQFDYLPEYYSYRAHENVHNHWTHNRERPFHFKEFDWSYESEDKKPILKTL